MALIKIHLVILFSFMAMVQAADSSNTLSEINTAHKKSLLILEKKYIECQIIKQQSYLKKLEDYKLGVMQAGNLAKANEVQKMIESAKKQLTVLSNFLKTIHKSKVPRVTKKDVKSESKPKLKEHYLGNFPDATFDIARWVGSRLFVFNPTGTFIAFGTRTNGKKDFYSFDGTWKLSKGGNEINCSNGDRFIINNGVVTFYLGNKQKWGVRILESKFEPFYGSWEYPANGRIYHRIFRKNGEFEITISGKIHMKGKFYLIFENGITKVKCVKETHWIKDNGRLNVRDAIKK